MQQAEMLRNEALGATLVKKLKLRGFDAYYCADKQAALKQALALIPQDDVVSWGGSVTIDEIGLLGAVKGAIRLSTELRQQLRKKKQN